MWSGFYAAAGPAQTNVFGRRFLDLIFRPPSSGKTRDRIKRTKLLGWMSFGRMTKLKHELWEENADGVKELMFCLSGPHGDQARSMLGPDAKLIWTVEAGSHFEAMTRYYEFMDWGEYTTDQEWDLKPYPDEWANGSL